MGWTFICQTIFMPAWQRTKQEKLDHCWPDYLFDQIVHALLSSQVRICDKKHNLRREDGPSLARLSSVRPPKFSLICPTWHLVPSTLLWQKISWPKLSVSQRLEQIACVTSFHKVWFNSSYKWQCIHAGLSLLNTCTSLYKPIQAYALYSIQVCTSLYKSMQVYARLNTMQLRCTLPFPEEVPHPRSHQHSTESIIFCRQDFDLIFWPSLHSLYCRK